MDEVLELLRGHLVESSIEEYAQRARAHPLQRGQGPVPSAQHTASHCTASHCRYAAAGPASRQRVSMQGLTRAQSAARRYQERACW